MGREIRRVPPRWQHPRKVYDSIVHGRKEGYQPLYNHDFETAMKKWLKELDKWVKGGFEKKKTEYDWNSNEPYRAFFEWHGGPPDPEYCRPVWNKGLATWFQVYETVSEGTPVTPPFATKGELVDYLVTNGDLWDQERGAGGWKRENAEAFVNAGSAPTLIVEQSTAGAEFIEPRDTK